MGISVKELLSNDYFKDFKVVAGRKGLAREIQGIAFLEAPDAFKWSRGCELVVSSGFILKEYPECITEAKKAGHLDDMAAMMIKAGRYLDHIPEEMIELFDEIKVPLIQAPFSIAWMDLITQINASVINRSIMKFQLPGAGSSEYELPDYKSRKIRKILTEVEGEMKFPCAIFDIDEDETYYSSSDFRKKASLYNLDDCEFWNTTVPHTRHTLCDYINMSRYRLLQLEETELAPVSWIVLPIVSQGKMYGYFVILESRELIDYYDETMVRIAYLALLSLYENLHVVSEENKMSFESLINYALTCDEDDLKRVATQATMNGISITEAYDHLLLEIPEVDVNKYRVELERGFYSSPMREFAKFAIIGKHEILLITPSGTIGEDKNLKRDALENFKQKIKEKIPNASVTIAIVEDAATIVSVKRSVSKCRRVMGIGKALMPEREVLRYSDLGPLAWIRIPDDEIGELLHDYRNLSDDMRNQDVLETLNVYLSNNMNYSVTAEKLNVHINTVRKRIAQAEELLHCDFNDPVERMKIILLIDFLRVTS